MTNIVKVVGCFLVALTLISCTDEIDAANPPVSSTISISGTLPVLYIETEGRSPIVSKEVYLNATYRLDPMGAEGVEALGTEAEPLPMQIRGRGHSSWKGPKKPYKIKLAKRTAMMGMPKNKHWALLKPTENTVAGLQLGKLMELAWTPSFRPVEVVLNGDYIGLYFLTETIRIDDNRVNIYEQQDLETNPGLIKGGWLVEVDNYHDECQITIPENNRWNLTLRYHSPEELSEAQLQWLTDEFKAINAAIYSADKSSTEWEKYIDVESIARFFILQEIMDNPDGTYSLTPHFVRKEPLLDQPFRGYTFTAEDKVELSNTGNLGKAVDLKDPATGEVHKCLVSIDRLTNEIESIPVDKIFIKQKVANINLTMQQIGILKNGGLIKEQHVELPNGQKFTADLQYNASKRDIAFVNSAQYRQQNEQEAQRAQQSRQQGGQQSGQSLKDNWHDANGNPKRLTQWYHIPLDEQKQADYLAGKQVLVGEGKDRSGNDCTIYLQYDPKERKPQTTRVYPDRDKVVGIAEESKTQMAVNNDGKTNEATKNVNEPLQRGQTEPKDEAQQEKQHQPKLKTPKP